MCEVAELKPDHGKVKTYCFSEFQVKNTQCTRVSIFLTIFALNAFNKYEYFIDLILTYDTAVNLSQGITW